MRGVEVYVSELDVNDTAIAGSDAQVETAVAQTYQDYLADVFVADTSEAADLLVNV